MPDVNCVEGYRPVEACTRHLSVVAQRSFDMPLLVGRKWFVAYLAYSRRAYLQVVGCCYGVVVGEEGVAG